MSKLRNLFLMAWLLAGLAHAGAPTYIEPGSGVGGVLLGDSLRTVRVKMGGADPTRVMKHGDSLLVMYDPAGLVYVSDSSKIVKAVHVTSANLVVAGTSVGVGSTAGDVRAAFGAPDGEKHASRKAKIKTGDAGGEMAYTALGVRFLMEVKTQVVREIAVFRGTPGR